MTLDSNGLKKGVNPYGDIVTNDETFENGKILKKFDEKNKQKQNAEVEL